MATTGKIQWKTEILNRIIDEQEKALVAAGFQIEAYIKKSMGSTKGEGKIHIPSAPGQPPAVDTGRLRASISTNWTDSGIPRGRTDKVGIGKAKDYVADDGVGYPGGSKTTFMKSGVFKVVVGTNVSYGCILGAGTSILTDKGAVRISWIKEGDKVLTQTGDYKKVLKVFKKPALETPNMITFNVEWRKGSWNHELTVTEEHKILVNRDGRNKWVKAKEVLPTDLFFSRKKIEKLKGFSKFPSNFCPVCGIEIKPINGRRKKYCSREHLLFGLQNGMSGHIGMKRKQESKDKMSSSAVKRLQERPETHANVVMSQKGYITSTEKQIYEWLILKRRLGRKIKKQHLIGRHFVDFYIPTLNEVYETDGAYWHQDQEKDIKRDKDLLAVNPELKINHIHFWDERYSPKNMVENPLPNVNYSICNPNVDSFVNIDIFETKKILSIKKWVYGKEELKDKRASWHGSVYDLCIEDIHSYYANGILVSNSILEFGAPSRNLAPRPFVRPALDWAKPKIEKMLKRI